MKKLFKKITRYFKSDRQLFIEELNNYRQILDNTIKILEEDILILKLALKKHIKLGDYLDEKKASKLMRVESINKIVIQYVKMRNEKAAREMIREKVKEQQNLQVLDEIIDMQNQRIQEYQFKLKQAFCALDYQKSYKEAFMINQKIAIQELMIYEKLDKGNCKKHIERVQREILNIDTFKSNDLGEISVNDEQIDGEIDKELSFLQLNYSSSNV